MITRERLQELLRYEPDTGKFYWICKRGVVPSGSEAGWISEYGYVRIAIDKRSYMAHRLAWLYIYGVWPDRDVDHVNGDRCDNRVCNLRLASRAENIRNSRKRTSNRSGLKGVCWKKNRNKWHAQITVDGKGLHLGFFDDKYEAHEAYCRASKLYHGEFSRVD